MQQQKLSLAPIRVDEVDSISMGILPNGETFLSLQGVARFCGMAPSAIIQLAQDWAKGEAQGKLRGQQLTELIKEWTGQDTVPDSLYVQIPSNNSLSNFIHAVPEQIVMAITDYYAHFAATKKQEAISNYRKAARHGLRRYIYDSLSYNESDLISKSWALFQERILLNQSPKGYFTMFDEATSIIASLIRHNIPVDDSIMPDASLGKHWGKYWNDNELQKTHGEKIKIQHKFPQSYRQLDPEINAYPNACLSIFRDWFENTYLPNQYPKYIKRKVKDGKIQIESLSMLLDAVLPPTLEAKRL